MRISKALLIKYSSYDEDGMLSPDGTFYPSNGSHPDWAQENYKKFSIDFHPTKNGDYEVVPEDEAYIDDEGLLALDKFTLEGWLRIKAYNGVEGNIDPDNINRVKSILKDWAKSKPGRTLYVDDSGDVIHIYVSMTGRPDFSELDKKVATY